MWRTIPLAVVAITTTIAVSLALSAPLTPFTIEFFSSPVCDPSTFGEGQTYLGSKTLTTKETGRIGKASLDPTAPGHGHTHGLLYRRIRAIRHGGE